MQRIANQDQGAFEYLLERNLTGIRSYLHRLLQGPGNDSSTAEDLAQEVFLKAWQNAGQYNPNAGALSTWLYRIAHNQFLDHTKSASQKMAQAAKPTAEVAELASPDSSLEQQLDNEQALNWLNTALPELPLNQRSVIMLRYLQNQTNDQAAKILDLSSHAVESLAVRARKQLKQSLAKWQRLPERAKTNNGEIPKP